MKRVVLGVVFVSGFLYAPPEDDFIGMKEMERLVRHTAFFWFLPERSTNMKHKKHRRALVKYREDTDELRIAKNVLQQKVYQVAAIKDFIQELSDNLKRNKDTYEVSDYIYKKGPNGSYIGRKKV